MSVYTATPMSPGGSFNKRNRTFSSGIKENGVTTTSLVAQETPRSISELEQLTRDLIKGFEEDITPNISASSFWLSKAKESLHDFNDAINDYLVKQNERNMVDIDYESIYIYYRAGQIILTEVIPATSNFRELQDQYKELMMELLNNDMYYANIKSRLEKLTQLQPSTDVVGVPQQQQEQPKIQTDPLAARFNNLKRSFSSSTSPPKYTHLSPQMPEVFQPKPRMTPVNDPMMIPRSNSISPPPPPENISESLLGNLSESTSRPITPSIAVPDFPAIRSDSPDPTELRNNAHFNTYNNKAYLTSLELHTTISQFPESVLVIDFRSAEEFNTMHIYSANCSNVIHIDPASIREYYSAEDIEARSMILSSQHEISLFKQRNMFELVVVHDMESSTVPTGSKLYEFLDILNNKSSKKPLKRAPVVLSGGLQSWMKTFGAANVASNMGIVRDDFSIEIRQSFASSPFTTVSGFSPALTKGSLLKSNGSSQASLSSLEYHKSESEFFSQRGRSTPQAPQSKKISRTTADKPSTSPPIKTTVSGPTNVSEPSLLEAKKRQQQIDEFDGKLSIITGLSNMGNTCYMNCILQCLMGTKGLTKFFLMNDYESKINLQSRLGSKGLISKAFHGIVNDMYSRSMVQAGKQNFHVTPQKFKQTIGALNMDFRSYQQQDCSEFLNFLLDSLHEDLNQKGNAPKFPPLTTEEELHREKMPLRLAASIEWEKYLKTDFSSIVDFFQGQYLSRLQCTVCRTTSTTYNAFSTLSIPIPENYAGTLTLERCFEEFCKAEVLDGDDKWFCPHCNKKQISTQTLRISILPKNLIIHLKRFKIGSRVTKLDCLVKYPSTMSMQKYWPAVTSEQEAKSLAGFPDRGQTPPFNYELYGVVNHFGTLRSGHYTAYVDKGYTSSAKNGWCYFDDTSITRNCGFSKVVNKNAYVLFYRRV